jgi:hypothetical protein
MPHGLPHGLPQWMPQGLPHGLPHGLPSLPLLEGCSSLRCCFLTG